VNNFASDLGFTFQKSKSGDVQIFRHGKPATSLRAKKAADFMDKIHNQDFTEQQQMMARVTGNYKRGNERAAKNHPRDRQ